jgi:cobalamin biosynthesis protein CobT
MATLLREVIDSGAPPRMARLPMTPEEVAASYEGDDEDDPAEDSDDEPDGSDGDPDDDEDGDPAAEGCEDDVSPQL